MIEGFEISEKNWPLCEALLLRSAIAEPKILRVILDINERTSLAPDLDRIERTISAICLEHGPLRHGNEVLWALWAAKKFGVVLGDEVARVVSAVDDDLVALTALHLESEDRIAGLDKSMWQSALSACGLYSQHWLLAYEASIKGWLDPPGGSDLTLTDDFFKILRGQDVSFYDVTATEAEDVSEYSEDTQEGSDSDVAFDYEEDPSDIIPGPAL
jgi:hypothetical protein